MDPTVISINWIHILKVVGEAGLAGIVAFGTVYGASGDLRSALIAGAIAAITKACPSAVSASPVVLPPK